MKLAQRQPLVQTLPGKNYIPLRCYRDEGLGITGKGEEEFGLIAIAYY